ncbi:MAG TPA: MYXO-CTERM sorting domain-containing protein [Myxococcales bacterium]
MPRTPGIPIALAALLAGTAAAHAAPEPGDAEKLDRLVAGLRESAERGLDGEPLFPRDLRIVERSSTERGTRLVLGGSWNVPEDRRLAELLDALRHETLMGALTAHEVQGGVLPFVADRDGVHRLGGEEAPRPRAFERQRLPERPPPPTVLKPISKLPKGGALMGKRIAISAGHGWIEKASGWETQRSRWDFTGCGTCRGITEDFYNAEVVTWHIIPLLQAMGAELVLVREPDPSVLPEAIVDDGDPGYSETGAWQAGTATGGYGGDYRASPAGPGEATFAAQLSAPGLRHVAVRWVEGTNRTAAVARVHHAGGISEFDLYQPGPGKLWLDLGEFWFGLEQARVVLANPGSGYLVADAVKFGGGVHAATAKPWWQMSATAYVPWAGTTSDLTGYSDPTIRPAYVEQIGADAFLSFHGNAAGGSAAGSAANGLSTYRYSCSTYADYSASDDAVGCDDPPGSKALADALHYGILGRVRADWDPNFGNRGRLVANFGEVRELDDTPGALIESAFFDNLANPSGAPPPKYPDNRTMHDPRWRDAVAYGLADGLAKFFDPTRHAPPQRPDGLRAINQADGTLKVSWNQVAGAEGYLLYVLDSPDVGAGRERAFDAGRFVGGTETVLADLVSRKTYAFRVAAVDGNGVGFASQAVAARVRGARHLTHPAAEVLLVAGYDRRDAWVQEIDNDGAYSVEHAQALAAAAPDVFFDGALDEAVVDGTLSLAPYRMVDYAAGKDSVEHESVSQPMQALVAAYLGAGGALLLSGEEVGYDLVNQGDATDRAFATGLGLGYAADDADTFSFDAVAGGPFDGLGSFTFDDGTKGVYRVEFPDVLAEVAGTSKAAMTYPGGGIAALAAPKVIAFGMGLETVVPASSRAAIFGKAVAYLAPGLVAGDLDLDGASDACETQYGFDPADAVDGAQDADGDGVSNAAECQAGTDPRSAAGLDAGRPDAAAGADAANAADGNDAIDATEVADAEAAAGPDAAALDASLSGPDASAGRSDAAVRTDSGAPAAPQGGCGCSAAAAPQQGIWLLLFAMAALRPRRR